MFCREISHLLLDSFPTDHWSVKKKRNILSQGKSSVYFCDICPSNCIIPQKAQTVTAVKFQRDSGALSSADTLSSGASGSLHVSTHHPVPSQVTGREHRFVPATVQCCSGNKTVYAMCCVAWFILTSCLASSVVTSVLSESAQTPCARLSSASPQTKPCILNWGRSLKFARTVLINYISKNHLPLEHQTNVCW